MPSALIADDHGQRFASRVEAFSDLVFGFSISLLAARLEVPPNAREILTVARFVPFLVTFVIICILWLEHYRVFRLGFVAKPIDITANFVFLFAIACLPYSLQTFMRFPTEPASVELYLGDLALVFVSLATLQLRALLYGNAEVDEDYRTKVWRRVITKLVFGAAAAVIIVVMHMRLVSPTKVVPLLGPAIVVIVVIVRAAASLTTRSITRVRR